MPGLVQVAVSTELFKEAGRGQSRAETAGPAAGPAAGLFLLQCPPLSLSPRGQDLVIDSPSLSPLPGQLLYFLDTLRVTQLIQKQT